MSNKRKKNPDAEYLQRLLATLDDGTEYRPAKSRPVERDKPHDKKGQCEKVQDPIGSKIGLVVGSECRRQLTYKWDVQLGNKRRERCHQRKQQESDAKDQRDPVSHDGTDGPGSPSRKPCTQYEQQLPRKRIEKPVTGRIRGQIPMKKSGGKIKQQRSGERPVSMP